MFLTVKCDVSNRNLGIVVWVYYFCRIAEEFWCSKADRKTRVTGSTSSWTTKTPPAGDCFYSCCPQTAV